MIWVVKLSGCSSRCSLPDGRHQLLIQHVHGIISRHGSKNTILSDYEQRHGFQYGLSRGIPGRRGASWGIAGCCKMAGARTNTLFWACGNRPLHLTQERPKRQDEQNVIKYREPVANNWNATIITGNISYG